MKKIHSFAIVVFLAFFCLSNFAFGHVVETSCRVFFSQKTGEKKCLQSESFLTLETLFKLRSWKQAYEYRGRICQSRLPGENRCEILKFSDFSLLDQIKIALNNLPRLLFVALLIPSAFAMKFYPYSIIVPIALIFWLWHRIRNRRMQKK